MKWQIMANIFVDEEKEAKEIFNMLSKFKHLFRTIKAEEVNEEGSYVMLIKCYHDEPNPQACEIVDKIEVGGVESAGIS